MARPLDMTSLHPPLQQALSDRYEFIRELGAGGMATVYLARDRRHDRDVAIRVLREALVATISRERSLREIQLVAKLAHPHILPLFDSGEAGGALYFVMPNVEGASLRELLNAGRIPVDEAVRIATEVAGALDFAHRHHVVHRDIKPENIMMLDGHALVADSAAIAYCHEAVRLRDPLFLCFFRSFPGAEALIALPEHRRLVASMAPPGAPLRGE